MEYKICNAYLNMNIKSKLNITRYQRNIQNLKIGLIKIQYLYAMVMMMKKCNNYKYPSVLECVLKLWRCLCAKYFDKQTHILVRNAIMLFLCRRRGRGKGCRGIILLTSWLMVHHGSCVVGRLYAHATRLLLFLYTMYKANAGKH